MYGAWRLAHLDRTAMVWFDRSIDGFWRSFWAAAIVYPGFLVLLMVRVEDQQWERSSLFHIVMVETIGYVVSWTAFPLAVLSFSRWLGREPQYLGFMVAYNWSQLLQTAASLAVVAITAGDMLPAAVATTAALLVTLAALLYEWFIAKVALEVTAAPAAAIVLLDLVLSLFVNHIAAGLY
jgi:hypothetical protein